MRIKNGQFLCLLLTLTKPADSSLLPEARSFPGFSDSTLLWLFSYTDLSALALLLSDLQMVEYNPGDYLETESDEVKIYRRLEMEPRREKEKG